MTRTQRILGLSGICLLLSGFAGCYFNRDNVGGADADGDGWEQGADCNDDVATVYPGAPEICGNGLDDDCDGKLDFDDPECQGEGIGGSDDPTTGSGGMGQGGNGAGGDSGVGGDASGGSGSGGDASGGGGVGGDASGGAGVGGDASGGSSQGGSSQGGSGQGGS